MKKAALKVGKLTRKAAWHITETASLTDGCSTHSGGISWKPTDANLSPASQLGAN
jgi:hypothetical protein